MKLYMYVYLLISSNSCVLSRGVFMAMDSTASLEQHIHIQWQQHYHIRGKYVFPDDLRICSLISLCIYVAYRMMNST